MYAHLHDTPAHALPRVRSRAQERLRAAGRSWPSATGCKTAPKKISYFSRWIPHARSPLASAEPRKFALFTVASVSGSTIYAYVANNPLLFVDPDGLILFAFDGTGNERGLSDTNVWQLAQIYDDADASDRAAIQTIRSRDNIREGLDRNTGFYIQGAGTSDAAFGTGWLDGGIGFSMSDRINAMLGNLDQFAIERYKLERQNRTITTQDPLNLTLDVMGFSRGAAQARDFVNQVLERRNSGYYRNLRGIDGGCITLHFRFLGIFDTVLAAGGPNRRGFNIAIPTSVQYVAHAVASNEHRAKFQLESIGASGSPGGNTRIERGFVGAHADVGGGYNGTSGGDGGDLSDVALNWMYEQAFSAGVRMGNLSAAQQTVSNPIVHDERNTYPFNAPIGGQPFFGEQDRNIRTPDGRLTPERTAPIQGLTNQQAMGYVQYQNMQRVNQVGLVDMNRYRQWLASNYQVNVQ
jgi:Uncharacterized alpha/beta hydrolase domain (DUF2235)